MDILTPEQRKKAMKGNKSLDTKIELRLRKALWAKGYRYYKNFKGLVGKPDIVISKYKIAIFCDSEFWHGYDWDNKKGRIQTNKDYWVSKIEHNIERDRKVDKELSYMGWTVLHFWGEQINNSIDDCISTIEETIFLNKLNDTEEHTSENIE